MESGEVLFESFFQGFWECDDAVFSAFAVMNRDGALAERRSGSIRGLAEFLETEADEAAVPVNVGFLGGDGVAFESNSTAEGINEFGEFRFVMGGLFRRLRLQDREFGSHLDRFTGEGAVVRLQRAGLVREGLPVERGRPWDGEDIASENAGGISGLAKLPVGDGSGTAKGIEIRLGAFGGLVALGLGPGFRPADVVVAGSGLDGERGDALEKFPAGGGRWVAGWMWL